MLMKIGLKLFLLVCFLLPAASAFAQCPMCRLNAENSNMRAGLNEGILYLLAAPFLLVGGAYLYWHFNRKKFGNG
jgi:hypothetical protein